MAQTADLMAHARRLEPHLAILKPEGPGPFPVSLQFHGCGGILEMQFRYAQAARDAGVAVVVVDSFVPRGVTRAGALATICTGARFRGPERAIDVLAALAWVRSQPWADTDRIAASGWSHGAWAVMEALSGASADRPAAQLSVRAAILFYPYCGPLAHTAARGWGENRPAVRACLGGRDVVVGVAAPRRALRRLEADGLSVRTLLLKEAAHCFDENAPEALPSRYRSDLAEIARDFYVAALRESLLSDIHGRVGGGGEELSQGRSAKTTAESISAGDGAGEHSALRKTSAQTASKLKLQRDKRCFG